MTIPLGLKLLSTSSDPTRKLCTGRAFYAPLFDLAPRRVWLFSLQRLHLFRELLRILLLAPLRVDSLPFPVCRSMPWTFSLFHCSSTWTTLRSSLLEGRYPLRYPMESGLSSLKLSYTFRELHSDHPQDLNWQTSNTGHQQTQCP
jgi:hypothetical protein